MARIRRFRVESLTGLNAGATLVLQPSDARHARVLRLKPGAPVELFDSAGLSATGAVCDVSNADVRVTLGCAPAGAVAAPAALTLATAWPKGKRAATLVEKCAELGVGCIVPVQYARSVVEKDDESSGVERLRRIAAEAAKQSGRTDVPRIDAPHSLAEILADTSVTRVLLDPRAKTGIAAWFQTLAAPARASILFIVGPEGGFSSEELASVDAANIARVRLGEHVLRVETAALAACAVLSALQYDEK